MEADEPHCTCGGNGICTYCTLQSYEPLPLEARGMMIALDMTESALRRPAKPTNVVEFRPGPTRLELVDREPTDDAIYNRGGVEGGIGYTVDEPGSLGENDWRL